MRLVAHGDFELLTMESQPTTPNIPISKGGINLSHIHNVAKSQKLPINVVKG